MEISGICVMVGNDDDIKSAVIRRIKNKNLSLSYAERVWVVENPENNLHPEMQTVYAEFYAKMAEDHRKMLVTTNSFHFLEAFMFFMEQEKITITFYIAHDGIMTTSACLNDAYKNLSQPSFDIVEMKFESEMERK